MRKRSAGGLSIVLAVTAALTVVPQSNAFAAYGLGLSGVSPSWARNVVSVLYATGETPVTRRASDSPMGSAEAVGRRIASLTTYSGSFEPEESSSIVRNTTGPEVASPITITAPGAPSATLLAADLIDWSSAEYGTAAF